MSSSFQYNSRNPAVKRLMKEAEELREPTELYFAQPTDENLFEWHFTVRGPPDTDFTGGFYHGRILLPPEYPMKPPNVILLTPNGRFELHKKICLSISGFHPESWRPSWSIRTALLALIGFMPTHGDGAIGSLDYPPDERRKLARMSLDWNCPDCGLTLKGVLPPITDATQSQVEEANEIATQMTFKDESELAKGQEDEPEWEIRQRIVLDNSVDNRRNIGHVANDTNSIIIPATSSSSSNNSSDVGIIPANSRTDWPSLTILIVISFVLAALLLRRFYLFNEWRFHS